jgi:multidrug resistance efflux pump
MLPEVPNRLSGRKWLRRVRRPFTGVVPVVVWALALAGAFYLYRRIGVTGVVTGFADDQPVTLAHLEPGIVRDVHVQLYDQVVCGQVLLSMDDREERIQLAAIERDIERLRAEVVAEQARLDADNARAEADVEDLARRFAVDRATAHVDYLSQIALNAYDRILLRGATVEYEITQTLHERDNAAFRELNDIQTQVGSLQAKLERNAAVLDHMKHAFEEADQRWFRFAERDDVAAACDPVLTPLRLAIDVRQQDLEEIVRRIDSHVLRAPIDGQVTSLLAHAGDRVEAGDPLVKVSPNTTTRVVAYLPERVILTARVGAPVTVNCLADAGGRRRAYPGTIIHLSATVDEAPLRYRQIPTRPVWGRGLIARLDEDVCLLPGEAVTIAFRDHR